MLHLIFLTRSDFIMKKEIIKAWEEQGFDVKVEPDRLHLTMFVGEETILYTIDIDLCCQER